MRNGDRVVATPHDRDEVDLAALAEAVLLLMAAQPTDDPSTPVTLPPDSTESATNAGQLEREEPAE